MADMKIGMRGGFNLPPEDRQTNLTPKCRKSIEHTEQVAKSLVFTHFDGVELNITQNPPGAQKVHNLFFGH